jgi:hypothetical protein
MTHLNKDIRDRVHVFIQGVSPEEFVAAVVTLNFQFQNFY